MGIMCANSKGTIGDAEKLFRTSKNSSVTGDKNNLQFTWLGVLLQMAGVGHVLFVISLRLAIDGETSCIPIIS